MTALRSLFIASALAMLSACASGPSAKPDGQPLSPERLYPLALGSAWSYDVDTGEGEPVLAITRVSEAGDGWAGVLGGEGVRRYELRPEGVFQPQQGGYLLRAPIAQGATWDAGRGVTATVDAVGIAIETPAGRFTGCATVREEGGATGAVVTTTYCPDVGPAEVRSRLALDHGVVEVVARLRGYRIGPEPTEADAVKSE